MILKNRRRREVLHYLQQNGGESTLDILAEHIAANENDIDESRLSSSQRKRVYIGLYQAHLPKMDDARVIDFEKHRGTVELRDEACRLMPYLENETGWSVTRGPLIPAVAILIGLLVTAAWMEMYPIGLVPESLWALLTTGAVIVVTFLEGSAT